MRAQAAAVVVVEYLPGLRWNPPLLVADLDQVVLVAAVPLAHPTQQPQLLELLGPLE